MSSRSLLSVKILKGVFAAHKKICWLARLAIPVTLRTHQDNVCIAQNYVIKIANFNVPFTIAYSSKESIHRSQCKSKKLTFLPAAQLAFIPTVQTRESVSSIAYIQIP